MYMPKEFEANNKHLTKKKTDTNKAHSAITSNKINLVIHYLKLTRIHETIMI